VRATVALRLGRVSNLPTVWTNAFAGAALAGGELGVSVAAALLAAVTLLYTAGMFLNDFYDRDVDAIQRPSRPIPAGQAEPSEVLAVGAGALAAGVVFATIAAAASSTGSPLGAFTAASALATCVVVYDAIHKHTPLAVLVMAACRALVYLVAAAAVAANTTPAVLAGAVALFVYVTGMSAVARRETERRVTDRWPLALLVAPPTIALWLGRSEPASLALTAAFAAWTFAAVRPLGRGDTDVGLAVSRMIAGICLLDAALIAGRGRLGLAAVAALGAALTRLFQRRIPGT
jgi:4-hydroxybenzoate polyprenyltransferase